MSKFGRTQRPPPGYDVIEPTLTALENELRDKVNEPHEGLRKNESLWPVHQINWQKSRYVFDMYVLYKRISKQVYDYCCRNKIIDAALCAKWKKRGYERLCSTYVINTRNFKFGTTSICRVPRHCLADGQVVEDPNTGCRGCSSGPGGQRNIFGNKYGQYLASIQVAREKKREAAAKRVAQQGQAGRGGAVGGGGGAGPSQEEEQEEQEEKSKKGEDSDTDSEAEGPTVWAQDDNEAELRPDGAEGEEEEEGGGKRKGGAPTAKGGMAKRPKY